MKTRSLSFWLGCAVLTAAGALWTDACRADEHAADRGSRPGRYIVGLSPFLDTAVKDSVYRRIVRFLFEEMPLNSSLWIYDAYRIRTIAQMDVPNVRAFRSAKTRANQFKAGIRDLRNFLAATHERPAESSLNFDQAIRFPQFTDFVGENLTASDRDVTVIVLGGPLYVDDKEPGFSMVNGYFPSDGHIAASREESIFGLKSRGNSLEGVVVHYGYFGDPWVSEVHQEKVSRFWTLYLKGQGARLATFCGDLETVFNSVRTDVEGTDARGNRHEIDASQSKIEMMRITREPGVADWLTQEVLQNPAQRPPSVTVGPMKIGIRWKGDVDLDLYASAHREAETLFFENTRSAEGYYFKDHRSSPDREYEFVEFESAVDVWEVNASINLYEGSTPAGIRGEVRIEFEGRIFSGEFALSATRGNQGRTGSDQARFWTGIDIPAILKLRSIAASQRH